MTSQLDSVDATCEKILDGICKLSHECDRYISSMNTVSETLGVLLEEAAKN
jgi:hypothetical protein